MKYLVALLLVAVLLEGLVIGILADDLSSLQARADFHSRMHAEYEARDDKLQAAINKLDERCR